MLDHVVTASALFAFLASVAGMRLARRVPGHRSQSHTPGPSEAQASGPPESRPAQPSPSRGRSGVPDAGQSGAEDADPVFRCYLNNHAHAVEFVEWMRGWGSPAIGNPYSSREIMEYYAWWTRDARVFPIDENLFLTALGKLQISVRKKRSRVKSPSTGKALRLSSGSPVRPYYYTILAADEVHVPTGAARSSAQRSRRAGAVDRDAIVAGHQINRRAA